MSPLTKRLGDTVSRGVYLRALKAMGVTVSVTRGMVTIFAGTIDSPSHRPLATLAAGRSHRITNPHAGEVASVQGDAEFSDAIKTPAARIQPLRLPCAHPTGFVRLSNRLQLLALHTPNCSSPPWVGDVIAWPSWAAYETQWQVRWLFANGALVRGEVLHPYMGVGRRMRGDGGDGHRADHRVEAWRRFVA